MPYFTLHRDYVLRTTKGHSIGFRKGEPTWVPPVCVPDVVAIGGVSDEAVDVVPPEDKPVVEIDVTARAAKIVEAFKVMESRDERGDFTASGLPHCKRLESMVGFEVLNGERDQLWQEYKASKAAS